MALVDILCAAYICAALARLQHRRAEGARKCRISGGHPSPRVGPLRLAATLHRCSVGRPKPPMTRAAIWLVPARECLCRRPRAGIGRLAAGPCLCRTDWRLSHATARAVRRTPMRLVCCILDRLAVFGQRAGRAASDLSAHMAADGAGCRFAHNIAPLRRLPDCQRSPAAHKYRHCRSASDTSRAAVKHISLQNVANPVTCPWYDRTGASP